MTKEQLKQGKILETAIRNLEMFLAEIECGSEVTVGVKHNVWFCDDELKEMIAEKLKERLDQFREDFDRL